MVSGSEQERSSSSILVRQSSSFGCCNCVASTDSINDFRDRFNHQTLWRPRLGTDPHPNRLLHSYRFIAVWWASTDLTTQGKSLAAVNEWAITAATETDDDKETRVPSVVDNRKISNVVSCLFALYIIMW
jgi:hypothetical protein